MDKSLLKRVSNLERYTGLVKKQDIRLGEYNFVIHENTNLFYKPHLTGYCFHQCEERIRLAIGPFGSGKSVMCMSEIILRAVRMPKSNDGVRYSRWAIIRNTYGELETTSLKTWMAWFGTLGLERSVKKPNINLLHRFDDGDGIVELEVIFMSVDREGQTGKFKSLDLTGVYFNELSEIPHSAFDILTGRVGRYPTQQSVGAENFWNGCIADTNPPDNDHWIVKDFDIEKKEGYELFKQPPGLIKDENGKWETNEEAENLQHLPSGYYKNMAQGKTTEFIKVYCLGQYGTVLTGKNVFPEYNDDFHSKEITWIKGLPVDVGFDLGLNPCAVFSQELPNGQIYIVHCLTTERDGLRQFLEKNYLPFVSQYLRDFKFRYLIADPAGRAKSQTDFVSCFETFQKFAINVEPAHTNDWVPRREAVRECLMRAIDGQPALVINKTGCEMLRKGFLGHYHYKRVNMRLDGVYHDVPNKNEYSHPQDALQYILLKLRGNLTKKVDNKDFTYRMLQF